MTRLLKMVTLGAAILMALPAASADAAKVVVDPGHGGKDPGARGVNGLYESYVNLDISLKLRDELVRRGYEVVMTRTDDVYLSLPQRVEFTNEQSGDLFVSVHANWYKQPSTNGSMVLYYDDSAPQADYPASAEMKALTPESRTLAQNVQNRLVDAAGTADLGLTKSAVYVVRMGTVPSILVETGFLSNAGDAKLLADDNARRRMAAGIASGIEAYYPPTDPSLGEFQDLRRHWSKEAVLRLHERGIVEGAGSGFMPERAMTRAEFVTMLERAMPLPACVDAGAGGTAAADDAEADGAADTVAALKSGAGGKAPVMKPQASGGSNAAAAPATSVAGAVYGCSPEASTAFTDAAPSHWAYASLQKAVRSGLLQGYPDGTLRPDSPLKRAEAAALLQRYGSAARLALPVPGTAVPAASAAPFADVPGTYWAAADIAALAGAGVIDGAKNGQFQPERAMTRAEMAAMLDRYLAALPASSR
ncbi:N-acetylmuramoyl-L-alanine amidase [Paenibacillus chartarius]|uniref:N-acetylmuramoyl-L-alanine amidase n=1 Tax=Paenibacillus chartarius TaxID=747481 RepID=A0ABV6DIY5_9BACL